MNQTPNANRLHIALFGRRNSGKSSLLNALTGQQAALVSDIPGTTTDPVFKAMELHPLGPCVFIDTAGFDDVGELGRMRVQATQQVLDKTDIAIVVVSQQDLSVEAEWIAMLQKRNIPVLPVVSKADVIDGEAVCDTIRTQWKLSPVLVSAFARTGMEQVRAGLLRLIPEGFEVVSITARWVQPQDVVLLVMPQDIQAPKGRLILPQVQTIRDLLDNQCIVMSVTTTQLPAALAALKQPPQLIVTDSQLFGQIEPLLPESSKLTSFSVLFAHYKGDVEAFRQGAQAIDRLADGDKVLIAESCTHAALDGDIAREKLPKLLRAKTGKTLDITVVSGVDFPTDLSPYALVIHCGGCMFNRRYVLSRVELAKQQNIPITNYGVALAKLNGVLDQIIA